MTAILMGFFPTRTSILGITFPSEEQEMNITRKLLFHRSNATTAAVGTSYPESHCGRIQGLTPIKTINALSSQQPT